MDRYGSEEKILDFIIKLNAAIANVRLFPPTHHSVVDSIESAYAGLTGILSRYRQLALIVVGDDLVANSSRLPAGPGISQFVVVLREKAVDNLTFLRGIRKESLRELIEALASHEAVPVRGNAWIKLSKIEGSGSQGSLADSDHGINGEAYDLDQDLEPLLAVRGSMQKEVKNVYERVRQNQDIEIQALEEIISSFVYGPTWMVNPLHLLADVKSYDEYTFVHMVNVCTLSMSQAESLGFKGKPLRQIGLAAVLHDVGKLFVPDEIINKPGKLSPEEWEIMATHPLKGVRHLMKLSEMPKLAVVCALEHHMRWDGQGYPVVEEGWKPHIVSQMISVADVFDAMRSKRPYSEANPRKVVLKVLEEGRGTEFNPFLVDNFLKIISRF